MKSDEIPDSASIWNGVELKRGRGFETGKKNAVDDGWEAECVDALGKARVTILPTARGNTPRSAKALGPISGSARGYVRPNCCLKRQNRASAAAHALLRSYAPAPKLFELVKKKNIVPHRNHTAQDRRRTTRYLTSA